MKINNQKMNDKQKELHMIGKINKVLRGLNAALRCPDIQQFLANVETILTDKPSECKIYYTTKRLIKYKPIESMDCIFGDTGKYISLKLCCSDTIIRPSSTVKTESYTTLIIETKFLEMSEKKIKE